VGSLCPKYFAFTGMDHIQYDSLHENCGIETLAWRRRMRRLGNAENFFCLMIEKKAQNDQKIKPHSFVGGDETTDTGSEPTRFNRERDAGSKGTICISWRWLNITFLLRSFG
jgi:hypothetical protein